MATVHSSAVVVAVVVVVVVVIIVAVAAAMAVNFHSSAVCYSLNKSCGKAKTIADKSA